MLYHPVRPAGTATYPRVLLRASAETWIFHGEDVEEEEEKNGALENVAKSEEDSPMNLIRVKVQDWVKYSRCFS